MAWGIPSALAPRAVGDADRPWSVRLSALVRSRRFHRALKGAAVYSVATLFVYIPALTGTVQTYFLFVMLTVVLHPPGVAVGSALQGLTQAVIGTAVGLVALASLGQLAGSPVALAVCFSVYLYVPSYVRASVPSLITPVMLSLLIPAGSLWKMGVAGSFSAEMFSEAAVAVPVGLGLSLVGSVLLFPEFATDAASAKLTSFLNAAANVTRAFGDEYLHLPSAKSSGDVKETGTSSDADVDADADAPSGKGGGVDAVKDSLIAKRRAAMDDMDAALGALAPAVQGVVLERPNLDLFTLRKSLGLCQRIQRTLLAAIVTLPFLRRGTADDDFLRRSRKCFLAHVETSARALFGAVADYLEHASVYYKAPNQQLPCVQRLHGDMDGLRSLLDDYHEAHQRGLAALWKEPQFLPCDQSGHDAKSDESSEDSVQNSVTDDEGDTDKSAIAEERTLLRWEKVTRGASLRYAIQSLVACCGELADLLDEAQRSRSENKSVCHRFVAIRNAFLPNAVVHPRVALAGLRNRARALSSLPPHRSGGTLFGVRSPADVKGQRAGDSDGDDSGRGRRRRSGSSSGQGTGNYTVSRKKGGKSSRHPTEDVPSSTSWSHVYRERLAVSRHVAHVILRAWVFEAAGRYALKLSVVVLIIHALFLASATSAWTTRWGGNATLLVVIVHCDPTVGGGLQRMFFLTLCALFAAAWGWVTLRVAVAAAVTNGVSGARELLALPVLIVSTAVFGTGSFYILAKKSRFFYCGIILMVVYQAIVFPGYLYLRDLTGPLDMDAIHAFTLERLSGTGLALGIIFVIQVLIYPNLARSGIKVQLADALLRTHACYLLLTSSRAAECGEDSRAVTTAALLTEERELASAVQDLRVQLGFAVAEPRLEATYPASIIATLLTNLDAVLHHLTFATLILSQGGIERVRHGEVRRNLASLRVAISVQLLVVAAAVRAGLALPPRMPDALHIRRKLLCSIVYHVQRLHAEETGQPPPLRPGVIASADSRTPGSGKEENGRAASTEADSGDGIGVPSEASTFPFSVSYLAYMGALGDCYMEVANMAAAARQLVGSLRPMSTGESESDGEGTREDGETACAGSGDDTDGDYDGQINDDYAGDLEEGLGKR
ncbi:hypothetical protein MMPV_003199 [Pyropia vietnamensis]